MKIDKIKLIWKLVHFSSKLGVANGFWENETETCSVVVFIEKDQSQAGHLLRNCLTSGQNLKSRVKQHKNVQTNKWTARRKTEPFQEPTGLQNYSFNEKNNTKQNPTKRKNTIK